MTRGPIEYLYDESGDRVCRSCGSALPRWLRRGRAWTSAFCASCRPARTFELVEKMDPRVVEYRALMDGRTVDQLCPVDGDVWTRLGRYCSMVLQQPRPDR